MNQEYIADKIREANEAGVAWATVGDRRIKLAPVPEHNTLHDCAGEAIIRNRGKIQIAYFVTKDAFPRFREYNRGFYFNYKQFMAMIVESHARVR